MNLRRVRELCLVAAFTVVLFLGLSNLGVLLDWVRAAMSLLMPFLIGVVVAFILNRVMIWLEKRVLCRLVQGDSPKVQKRRRGLALLSTYLLLLVAILVVVCIVALIFNVQSILTFAFPMIIGMISGVYSSICLSGPLWVMWQEHKLKKGKGKKNK